MLRYRKFLHDLKSFNITLSYYVPVFLPVTKKYHRLSAEDGQELRINIAQLSVCRK